MTLLDAQHDAAIRDLRRRLEDSRRYGALKTARRLAQLLADAEVARTQYSTPHMPVAPTRTTLRPTGWGIADLSGESGNTT